MCEAERNTPSPLFIGALRSASRTLRGLVAAGKESFARIKTFIERPIKNRAEMIYEADNFYPRNGLSSVLYALGDGERG